MHASDQIESGELAKVVPWWKPVVMGRCLGVHVGGSFPEEASSETCLGKTHERIEVPMLNERQEQTYYGALNLYVQKFVIKAYDQGNSHSTIAFL